MENQTAQMVSWLDEERRKDKAIISKLEERTASQAAIIQDQTQQIQSLESEITQLKSKLLTVSMFDESIARLRNEFQSGMAQIESRRTNVDQDIQKMRNMDREAMMKAIEELRQEMITRIDRAVQPRRVEEERLSKVAKELQAYADNLSKGMEEYERTLAYLEEQRRQDTRRISDLNSEIAAVSKKVEGHQPKIELLEDLSRRNERTVTEVTSKLGELKQQQQDWTEEQALIDQERERMINDMVKRMDAFAENMETYADQVVGWAETHREIKKTVDEFERMADRVERRLNELSEMQRLSEERFRQEWEDFLTDDQKRWRQFTITNEEAWRENEKSLETVKSQITQITERVERQVEYLKHLSKSQYETTVALAERFQEIREEAEDTRGSLPALT